MSLEKQLRKYILPNILAMVGISCYILADTFFISASAGAKGITALNLTLPVYSLIFAIGAMTGMGFAIRYTLTKETDEVTARKMFSNAVEWCLLFSIIFVALGIFCPGAVLRLMGADDEILAVGTVYLKIAMMFAPFFMLNYAFTAFVRNDYSPKLAMSATLLSSLFNIVFDYIFVFPMGLGMKGAALATAVSPIISMCICMIHFLSKKNHIVFRPVLPSVHHLVRACQVGVSYFIGEIAGGIATLVFNYILLGLGGNIAVAAYGIIANTALVGTSVFNGISQGQQPLLSQLHAQNDEKGESRVIKHSQIIAFIIAAAIVVFVWIFAGKISDIFNSEGLEELRTYSVPGLCIYFTGYLFASENIVRSGYFGAIDRPVPAFVIAVSRGIAAIIIFAFVLSRIWGITGVWLAFPAAELFTLIFSLWYRRPVRKRKP